MSFGAIGAVHLNKRNMSAPTLFPQNPGVALSRETLEKLAKHPNGSRTSSPLGRIKFQEEHPEGAHIVTLNVSGRRYQTYLSTLQRFPTSLLGDPMKRKHFYKTDSNEYFFDRNRKAFGGVLHYFQSGGEIECPSGVSERIFAQELLFFEIYDQRNESGSDSTSDDFVLPKNQTLSKIWLLFEKPNSSKGAKIMAVFSIFIILLSITVFCLETIPTLNPDTKEGSHMQSTWYMLNIFCNAWFTIEFILRFIASPRKFKFIRSAVNLIDLLSILPFYISEVVGNNGEHSLAVLRVIRVIRVIRIFKLTRHSRGLHILANTIKASFQELLMLVLFLAIAVILFASAVYFAENHSDGDTKFMSIPHSFWWAVITMTTVGYGDLTPRTLTGQLVGTLCAISGVLVIALPVPVIVSNFEHFYKLEQTRQAREDEVIKKEESEETFADMRKSIQMMTHTSIILAGGMRKNNDQNNNSDNCHQMSPKQKTIKEKIQDKLSFTFQRPYSDIEQQSHSDQNGVCKTDNEDGEDGEQIIPNGKTPIHLPDINIDSPLPSRNSSLIVGSIDDHQHSRHQSSVSPRNDVIQERLWFLNKTEPSKESAI